MGKTQDFKYGDRITWTEGSQMDKMTHKGIVTKVETVLTVADDEGYPHTLTLGDCSVDISKGWRKK